MLAWLKSRDGWSLDGSPIEKSTCNHSNFFFITIGSVMLDPVTIGKVMLYRAFPVL